MSGRPVAPFADTPEAQRTFVQKASIFFGIAIGSTDDIVAVAKSQTADVWKSIKGTQPVWENTVIPKSFEIATSNGAFWVAPNASKHLVESIGTLSKHGVCVQSLELFTQMELKSFHDAVEAAAKSGIEFEKMYKVNGWELIFSPAQPGKPLTVLKHARFTGN